MNADDTFTLRGPLELPELPGRFLSKTVHDPHSGCLIWTGTTSRGYGRYRDAGKMHRAHRFAYEQAMGAIPADLELDHLCRRRGCVRPWHLQAVTGKVNVGRGMKARAMKARRAALTHCKHGHEFTDANTYSQPSTGYRVCIACKRIRHAKLEADPAFKEYKRKRYAARTPDKIAAEKERKRVYNAKRYAANKAKKAADMVNRARPLGGVTLKSTAGYTIKATQGAFDFMAAHT